MQPNRFSSKAIVPAITSVIVGGLAALAMFGPCCWDSECDPPSPPPPPPPDPEASVNHLMSTVIDLLQYRLDTN